MKQSIIKKLGLEPLPQEGVYFKQMHKSQNEIGAREQLISQFSQHINLIEKYTRVDVNI